MFSDPISFSSALSCNRFSTKKKHPSCWSMKLIERTRHSKRFLLELLAEFQITIPELGTIQAKKAPHVILTSNSSRELSDALKRRCLYHWIDYPDFEKELEIVRVRLPEIAEDLSSEVVRFIHTIRDMKLSKSPGVAETLDLSRSLMLLEKTKLDQEAAEETLGCILKSADDLAKVRSEGIWQAPCQERCTGKGKNRSSEYRSTRAKNTGEHEPQIAQNSQTGRIR